MNSEVHFVKTEINLMKTEMNDVKSQINAVKTEMHSRFDKMEAKLIGVGEHFELTNESRISDIDFIANKVNKLEKEVYFLKNEK